MFYAFNLTVTKFACLHLETFIKVNIPTSIGCIISQFLLVRFHTLDGETSTYHDINAELNVSLI